MIVAEGRTELGLIPEAPTSSMVPPLSTHMPTHMLYWALSHFLLQ